MRRREEPLILHSNWFEVAFTVQIHGHVLLRPLASAFDYQSFLANDEELQPRRLIRFLRTDGLTDQQWASKLTWIKRACLVQCEYVLPVAHIGDDHDAIVVSTEYCHETSLAEQATPNGISLATLEAIGLALESAHAMGVPHGQLALSKVYLKNTETGKHLAENEVRLDLLDGMLTDRDESAGIEVALADDVRACGLIFRDHLGSSGHTTLEAASIDTKPIQSLIEEMLQSDWSSRPSMSDVMAQWTKCVRPDQSGMNFPSMVGVDSSGLQDSGSTGDDATQELPAANSEYYPGPAMAFANMPLIGRFAIERSLGEGGMGAVYLARDKSNDEQVAIKVLSERMAKDEKAARRFAKEARLLSTLTHPSIAKLIEFNRQDDMMYLAMEFVSGGTLADFTRTQMPMNERLVIAAIADALRGLAVAHQNGMVHRDIKPANLLLTPRGERSFHAKTVDESSTEPLMKVADFGLAKHFNAEESMAMTQSGMVLGTPLYMAPEQCKGLDVGPPTDVYAIGTTIFQCLAGRVPFEGPSSVDIFRMQCDAPVPKLRTFNASVSDDIQQVVEKCMAKSADARYQNALELLQDLDGLLDGTSTSIALHPAVPEVNIPGKLRYQFQYTLRSSPEALWPYLSNTDRVNHAIGLPAIRYRTFQDPKLGLRRIASVRAMGMNMEWEEHPYEWIEGRRLSVLRQFPSGPFHWFTNVVELNPQSNGGTLVVQTLEMLPRNILGKWFAKLQIGAKSERNFGRVYEKIDEYLCSNSANNAATSNPFAASKPMGREQKRRFAERFERVRAAGTSIAPKLLDTLEQYLEYASDLDVARLRPIALAERFGLEPEQVVHACLLGAREGVLVLLWDILCPTCRIPNDVKETLKGLQDHGHCEACNTDFQLDFARSIELIFRAHPEIRSAETRTYCVGGPAFSAHVVAQVRLQGDERMTMSLRLSDGQYRIRGSQLPYVIDFRVAPLGKVGRWDLDITRPVEKSDIPILRSGQQVLALFNSHADPRQVRIERLASRVDALTAADAARLSSFREWFPEEVLSPGQLVSLTTVTLFACQIMNARELYAMQSDQNACSQMLRHLQSMATIVSEHSGCVIKTMNDGLNCVFPSVSNAVAAATQLSASAAEWNLAIRQAIHQGPAVVATINDRLDYYGQTPQMLDDLLRSTAEGELWLTDHCWNESGLDELFTKDWTVEMGAPITGWPRWSIVRAGRKQT